MQKNSSFTKSFLETQVYLVLYLSHCRIQFFQCRCSSSVTYLPVMLCEKSSQESSSCLQNGRARAATLFRSSLNSIPDIEQEICSGGVLKETPPRAPVLLSLCGFWQGSVRLLPDVLRDTAESGDLSDRQLSGMILRQK